MYWFSVMGGGFVLAVAWFVASRLAYARAEASLRTSVRPITRWGEPVMHRPQQPVTTYDDGFPKAPPTPPALSAVLKVGSTTRVARFSCAT